MNKSFSFNTVLLRCRAFMWKAPRTSSRPSLVFFYSDILKLSRGYRWWSRMNHIVCAPWKRFICYVEWRGDHGSSLLVVIIFRSSFSFRTKNFPRSLSHPSIDFILRRTFIFLFICNLMLFLFLLFDYYILGKVCSEVFSNFLPV